MQSKALEAVCPNLETFRSLIVAAVALLARATREDWGWQINVGFQDPELRNLAEALRHCGVSVEEDF